MAARHGQARTNTDGHGPAFAEAASARQARHAGAASGGVLRGLWRGLFGGERRGRALEGMLEEGGWAGLGGGYLAGHGPGREIAGLERSELVRLPAVMAALRNLSEGVGMMPLHLYERKGRVRERATGHPVYRVLHEAPNPAITAFRFKEWLINSCLLYGNFYAEIERDARGKVLALWPIPAWLVRVTGTFGRPGYEVTAGGQTFAVRAESMLHVRGYYQGGVLGLSLLDEGNNALSTAASADGYARRMFAQGTRLGGGVVTHPVRLSLEASRRFAEKLEQSVEGLGQSHRLMVLDEGATYQSIGINPKDAQMLEVRQFSVLEVARIFNVPPQRLYDLSRTTYNNAEQMGLEFVVYSLGPWCVRIEEELARALLTPAERATHYVKFLQAALLRGDHKSRAEAYVLGIQWGWLSPNDVREMEELNPVDGGDVYTRPLNMGPVADPPSRGALEGRGRSDLESRKAGKEEGKEEEEGKREEKKKDTDKHGQARTHTDGHGPAYAGAASARQARTDTDPPSRGASEGRPEQEPASAGLRRGKQEGARTWRELSGEEREARAKGRLGVRGVWRGRIRSDAGRVVKGELREVRKILAGARKGRNVDPPSLKSSEGRPGGAGGQGHGRDARATEGEERGLKELVEGLRAYYTGEAFREFVLKMLAPGLREMAQDMRLAAAEEVDGDVAAAEVENFVEAVIADIVEGRGLERLETLERVMAAAEAELDPADAAEETLDRWSEEGGDSFGDEAQTRLGEAVAVAVWVALGVTKLRWKNNAGACKFCQGLDGKVVGINKAFVQKGGNLGDGAGGSMSVSRQTMHPPVHGGCACFVVPEG